MVEIAISFHDVGNGHELALQTLGDPAAKRILMLHGGPGYYWLPDNLQLLYQRLTDAGHAVCLQALSARGCGIGPATSRYTDLLDDDLVLRAADLTCFAAPDILLGHSTGCMVALTAVMEGFCRPEKLLLVSPYTASLSEQDYWLTAKAAKYPRAFQMFYDFVAENWQLYKGAVPHDLRENLYVYWGELFLALPDRDLQVKAQLVYGNFHVIDALLQVGVEQGEPFVIQHMMLQKWPDLPDAVKDTLWRTATINANWWRSNYQNGYPFLEAVTEHPFEMPVHILSGLNDEITPPDSVKKLGAILSVRPHLVANCGHLAEANVQGQLDVELANYLSGMLGELK